MSFVATINVPGYLPMDDDLPVFDTARDAWDYLREERERSEDDLEPDEGEEYSETREALAVLSEPLMWEGDRFGGDYCGVASDGTGTIFGGTPGSDSPHDLGLVYSVSLVEDDALDTV